jgi:mannose-6-phosphate isomerase-like protein (cupin superfamily)
MIRHANEFVCETRTGMRGGKGEVRIEHLWNQDELKSQTRLCARLILPPGASIGFHEHKAEEELFYVVSGRGRITDQGQTADIGPGDTILTGGGAGHAVEATGSEPLIMLAVIMQFPA